MDGPSTVVDRPVVLVPIGYYPPAFLAGGPTRSVSQLVARLADELDFRVVTRASDLGSRRPLPGITADRWVGDDPARCLYLSRRRRLAGGLPIALRRTDHDLLYLNSIFSIQFSLVPLLLRRAGLLPRRGLLVAARGELDSRALTLKRRRKQLYLWLVRSLRLLDDASWHAATESEAAAIRQAFGERPAVLVARDLPVPPARATVTARAAKQPGELRAVFLGRVSRMKNLDQAVAALAGVRGQVTLDVYGPLEDRRLWLECRRVAAALPPGVRVRYRGIVPPDRVAEALAGYDLFVLPTRGESFGHAIVEALLAGCPVLISNATPWRDLTARRAGWDLPLTPLEAYTRVIQACVDMTAAELAEWSAGAQRLGREIVDDPALDHAYRAVFRGALARAPSKRRTRAPGRPASPASSAGASPSES